MNPDKADAKNVEAWGDKLDLRIGSHKFGYLKEHDPKYVVPGTMDSKNGKDGGKHGLSDYVVMKGDTIGSIAKKNNITVNDILKKNPRIKNPNRISIGQKIKL